VSQLTLKEQKKLDAQIEEYILDKPNWWRRFQIDLRTAFLLVAIVTLAIAHGTLVWRYHQQSQELDWMRRQFGKMAISDANRFSISALPSTQPDVWRWRIYAPPQTKLKVGIVDSEIPKKYVPSIDGDQVELVGSERGLVLTLRIKHFSETRSEISLDCGNGKVVSRFVTQNREDWFDGLGHYRGLADLEIESFRLNYPILLRKFRLFDQDLNSNRVKDPPGNASGYMVWIVPYR
jgi:hypothetical protein